MTLIHLVYASQPFGYDEITLASILAAARQNNVRNAITGSLICREDLYLQLLEGPEDEVEATYERIARDYRHVEVRKLVHQAAQQRLFSHWAMRHDPAKSWMWSQAEVAQGAPGNAKPAEVLEIFARLSAEVGGPL